ncbi:rhodopsin-like superfamily protein [Penicillium cf. griseofulvum]|uniref:Rhodopsin-like superfamily protein n=1 Tax=Penicillium cf. griseofulvum TaxID=2972120 RepID=A0A9W9MF64_9EURO|nr:rhodopsin-like superfamily protein [Penicillium cf. griseofulvum]KAJ5424225.1 rhodopsin-like superfamily protein [Penicillium cf. griseofulvum]KAJ5442536.1 GPCR rhodopsin-like superfamily protein [Penicillium cf. griseofulvum]
MASLILMGLMPRNNEHPLAARLTGSVELDIDPLPSAHRRGLIAISIMALLSLIATSLLLGFITYRLVFWRGSYTRYIGYNQYIILIYNLVLADFIQSLAFILCLRWILTDKIEAGTAACFLQGLWLQIGDPSSGLFVFSIAIHTFLLVVWGRKMSYKFFVCFVVGVWVFVVLIVIIPIGMHGADIFVPSGAWCWISEDYETTRLWTHYMWIFLSEFGTVLLYAVMYFQLRRQIAASSILGNNQLASLQRLRRVVGYMTIYPIVYVVLSLPLAAGRMATAHGNQPSIIFFCCAGAFITSSGLVDVVLYTLTRRNLLIDSEPSEDRSYNMFGSSKGKRGENNLTTITADPTRKHGTLNDDLDRDGSMDNIVSPSAHGHHGHDHELTPIGKVYQETTIEITHEPAYPDEVSSAHSSKEDFSPDRPPRKGWRR